MKNRFFVRLSWPVTIRNATFVWAERVHLCYNNPVSEGGGLRMRNQGDFLEYLKLEDMGVFTTTGYDPGVPAEKLEEIRKFGASL